MPHQWPEVGILASIHETTPMLGTYFTGLGGFCSIVAFLGCKSLVWVPFSPKASWPPGQGGQGDKGVRSDKQDLVQPVSMTEEALQELTSVNYLSFIPEYRGYIGLGTVVEKLPNLY